jgi:hypothetical protein
MQRDIERATISAVYLLAAKPSKHDVTVIPAGFTITKCPVRTAAGAHKRLSSRQGDGKPVLTPTNILKAGYANRGLRSWAAKG